MSWETEASNWIAWARAPGHDAYWYYRDSFFDEILPPAGRATLELGCGEGRVVRDLQELGHRVTGIDAAPSLVAAARELDPGETYLVADASALPFEGGSFDLVVAYNSLMDVDDMPGAVSEAGRVLEAGGRLCICVTHPFFDSGEWESDAPDARFVIEGSYFGKRPFEGTFERNGLTITFRGWCYSLGDYSQALEDAGFVIERIREPVNALEDPRRDRVPLFLQLRALKPA
jgi:SAM-dependent methyltransferase